MDTPNDTTPLLRCTKCKQEFPATLGYFYADIRYKSGFKSTCRTCQGVYRDAWQAKNREYYLDKKREWRKANPDKVKQYKRDSQKRNRDSANKRSKRWRERHPDTLREVTRIAAANRRHAPGKYTQADVDLMHKTQKGRCWWCGKKLKNTVKQGGRIRIGYDVDHRIALNKGGTSDPSNLVLACIDCNLSKQDKLPGEWNGRLL